MLEETAQADGIVSAAASAKKPAAKKKKAKKAKKATAKKPAAKKAKKAKKATAKKPAAKKAAKKPAKKKAAKKATKKVAKKAAKKPAKKKAAKKVAKKAAKKPAAKKKAVKKVAKKPAKKKVAKKAKKSVKKPNDGAAVNLKAFTTTASSKAEQSAAPLKKGIETLGSSLVSFAQDQIQETVQTAQQLLNCRSLEDVAAVQTKFVKQSFDRLVKQANKMAQTTANMAKGAAEPLSDRMERFFYANRAA